ncbi:ABC transporter substrate-binding protein [Methylobacterium sp. J-090]|uniref:ABC transporter substrate-binding protein n=1 Tax=Methylobacterium sp. J-090 TaxID=2836666 RepID=UPI001FB8820F|nr:ABC transporter substrate-binding protein [Methylobacterium sp. J-090]MCJ2082662.1 ABC transporter substrate-binding protein [Methylobacterium sp. J-090]
MVLVAAGPIRAEPVRVVDALGRGVVLAAPPRRIVTIFSSNTELVAALGLTDRIVGIDAFTRYPPDAAAKPVVGGRLGFSVEAIAAQNPDLVVLTPARQAVHQILDALERIGVPAVVLTSRTVTEVVENLRLLARATGVPERGEALASGLEARLGAVRERVATRPCRRVVMVTGRLGNGLLLSARRDTYTGDAILRAGGCFALSGNGAVPQVSPEAVFAADPDVLLLAGSADEMAELARRPGFSGMRAVAAGHAHAVPRTEFLIPGPRTVAGIERLAGLLHPAGAP